MCVPLQSLCGERGHTPAQPCRARAQGASAAPDVPIAVICENADDVAAFDDFQAPGLVEPATFAWQGFLKDSAAVRECGK